MSGTTGETPTEPAESVNATPAAPVSSKLKATASDFVPKSFTPAAANPQIPQVYPQQNIQYVQGVQGQMLPVGYNPQFAYPYAPGGYPVYPTAAYGYPPHVMYPPQQAYQPYPVYNPQYNGQDVNYYGNNNNNNRNQNKNNGNGKQRSASYSNNTPKYSAQPFVPSSGAGNGDTSKSDVPAKASDATTAATNTTDGEFVFQTQDPSQSSTTKASSTANDSAVLAAGAALAEVTFGSFDVDTDVIPAVAAAAPTAADSTSVATAPAAATATTEAPAPVPSSAAVASPAAVSAEASNVETASPRVSEVSAIDATASATEKVLAAAAPAAAESVAASEASSKPAQQQQQSSQAPSDRQRDRPIERQHSNDGGEWSRNSARQRSGPATGANTPGASGGRGGEWKRAESVPLPTTVAGILLQNDGVRRYDHVALLHLFARSKEAPQAIVELYPDNAKRQHLPFLPKGMLAPLNFEEGDRSFAFQPSENAFRFDPTRLANTDDVDTVIMKANLILNKLSLTNFDKLSEEFISSGVGNSEESVNRAIELIVGKAQLEEGFSNMYAQLCRKMTDRWSSEEDKKNADEDAAASASTSLGESFRNKLLERLANEFYIDRRKELQDIANLELSQDDKFEKEVLLKKRFKGHVKFVGEICLQDLVKMRTMKSCMETLVDGGDEESLVCLCKLFETIGPKMSTYDLQKNKKYVQSVLDRVRARLASPVDSNGEVMSSRIRFMLQDLIALAADNWKSRRETEKAKKLGDDSGNKGSSTPTSNLPTPRSQDARRPGLGGFVPRRVPVPGGRGLVADRSRCKGGQRQS